MVGGKPAFDEGMIAFCRWTAEYYQAPLGEVLRAALPQGEQATAKRAVRLTDQGRPRAGAPGVSQDAAGRRAAEDPILAALADAGGELPLQRLLDGCESRGARGASWRGTRRRGLVEVGDEMRPPRAADPAFVRRSGVGRPGAALPSARPRGARRWPSRGARARRALPLAT